MKLCKQVSRRALAILLSLMILATNIGVLPIFAADSNGSVPHQHGDEPKDNAWSGTTGSLVAGNYELNKYEDAILVSTGLIGDTYSVEVPDSTTEGLVSIDADAQMVTAKPYETDGFVWVPTAAVIKYTAADGSNGTDISVTLNKVGENYVGSFVKPANSYRIEVTYSLYIPVDAALQQALLNAPYYLVEGYDKVSAAVDGSLALVAETMNEKMEDLRQIASGSKYDIVYDDQVVYSYNTPALSDGDVKDALNDLLADYDANGGTLTLAKFCKAYQTAPSKVQFAIEQGAAFKEHIKWFYSRISAIGNEDGQAELNAFADSLPASVNTAIEDAVQTVINKAVEKAAEYNFYGQSVDFSSLKNKTRKDDAIYNEIEAKRAEVEAGAKSLEDIAVLYESFGNMTEGKKYRDQAAEVRSTGFEALDALEDGIRTIYSEGDAAVAEAETKAEEAKQVIDFLPSVVSAVRTINRQDWDFIGQDLVKESITAEEYKALDKVVLNAYDSGEDIDLHDDIELLDELFAASTVINALVDQYSISVEVKANVVSKNSVDTAATMALNVFSTNFPMDKNTAAADIVAAIEANGVEASALSAWDSYYNVGTAYYDRVVVITDAAGKVIDELGALSGDIKYTITYTPKTYTIWETYKPAGSEATVVPYGYNWRLPRPAELTKSYEYKVDGVAHRENTVIRIVKDIQVERTEGKAIVAKTLAEVIASSIIPGTTMSAKEKAVLNSGALLVDTISFRTPDSNDKLTSVKADGDGYLLTAETMHAGLLNSDAAWVPVSAYPVLTSGNGAPIALTKNGDVYTGSFECDELFSSVQVVYQMQIDGLDAATVAALVNIADTLVKDTAEQKAALDKLCNENNFYNNLGRVNSTLLGTVTSAVALTPAAKAALKEMTDLAMNPTTGNTFLYDYLTQYMSENGGLAYYYKNGNAANLQKQIALVNKNLPIIWNDAPVQDYLVKMGMESEGAKVEIVLDQLKATNLKPVNALVNTNSPFIDNMLAAVAAEGEVSYHNAVAGTVTMQQVLSAAAPGQASYGVEIQVLNKNDGVVETYKSEKFDRVGNTISVAELREMYDALLATIPNAKYYVGDIALPGTDLKLPEGGKIYTGALRPITYTVKIDGEADQILYAFDAYTITLPGTGVTGMNYIYNIGGNKVEVYTGATENFALGTSIEAIDALFGADRELVITRELIDVNKSNLLTFIEKFNVALTNSGLTFGNNAALAFIPMTDADGNLSVVLRVTSKFSELSPASLASEMMTLIEDLSYVGLNGNPLFGLNSDGELKLYVQSLINMLVNSGLGLDALGAMIEPNGNIKEMKLDGLSALGATGNSIVLSNGKVINNVNALGGKMMQATMQYGLNINNCTSVPFYVTYQDFDEQAAMLQKVKKGVEQIVPYVNVTAKDGALNLTVNAPDSAYAYMLTALLAVGQVNMDTLQSYDLGKIIDYGFGLLDPLFENDNISADTLINTIKETGFYDAIARFDLEAHKELINFLYNGIDHLHDHVSRTGSSVGSVYSGVLHYDALNVLLNSNVTLGEFSGMVAEKDTGVDLPITFTLKNRSAEYEALVLDIRADGITNKYYMSRKATDAISNASDDAIIILLSDVRGDIVVKNNVLLNLNGYTINGDVTANGVLSIVDSTLDTKKCGAITGEMTGNFNIAGGKYADDVSDYIEDGYYFDNNIVYNGCFMLDKNGENLDIYLGTDYLSLDKSAAKVMALDLVAKLIMNYYGCSELVVDGNTLYGVDLLNITESLRTPSILLSKLVECIDCEGVTAFATQFLADVTDFGALADAIENGNAVVNYRLMNSAFNPYLSYIEEDDCFALNLSSAADKQYTDISVYISDEVPVGHKNYMVKVLREMDTIISFNALGVAVNDVTYGSAGLSFEGSAVADVVVDLTTNVNYPIIIGALLADDATGAYRTDLIEAIKIYQTSYATDDLQKAIDKMTIAQLMSALENSKDKSFTSILKGLGITAPAAVELESVYSVARKVLGTIIDYSGKTGTDHALGGLKVAGTYSTYSYGIKKSADAYVKLTVTLMAEEQAIIVKDKNGVVVMISDNLANVLNAVEDGYTVYINKPVTLAEDVTLPGVSFTLVNADKINFNGKLLWFVDGNTTLITDKDISAHVTSDPELFCSAVSYTMDGEWYVFRLDGEAHEWVEIPAIPADCVNPGKTAGIACKHCGKFQVEPQDVPALGHSYETVVTAPTCFEEGYTTYTCINCGDSYKSDFVSATNHEGTTHVIPGYDATCTEEGMTECIYCSACGTVLKEAQKIPVIGHTPVLVPGYAASCYEDGLTDGYVCGVCGETILAQETIPAHHTPESYSKPATCTEPGIAGASKCSVCGIELEGGEIIPAIGHYQYTIPGYAPTCTEPGLTDEVKCNVCGEVLIPGQIIPPTGHKIAVVQGTPADCVNTGLTAGAYCPDCNHVYVAQELIHALGHNVVIDEARAPSCTVSGLTEGSHCSRCGEVYVAQEDIPVIEHEIVISEAVAPTVDATGLTEGQHCAVCGKVLVEQKVLAKLPYIHVPTISVENADIIRGGKVDAEEQYLFLDSAPTGLKVKDFPYVNFVIDNASESTVTIADGKKVRGENDLVCTGDMVTVWATNADGAQTSVSYTIIIMGDANCDGKLNVRDTALMKAAFVGELSLEGDGFLAADMNFDGKLNVRDTAAAKSKFVGWNDEYISQIK